jgi:SAM-dependent methyltransferase
LNIGTPISLGCDRSYKLLEIARQKGYEVLFCDILSPPYRPNSFDAVICIAVIHHLSTEEHRLHAIRNLIKIVKPGGEVFISVWALEQDDSSKRTFDEQDVIVPWKVISQAKEEATANSVFQRYCHVFKEGELVSLLTTKCKDVEVLECFYDHSNWSVRIKRLH